MFTNLSVVLFTVIKPVMIGASGMKHRPVEGVEGT